MDLGCGLEARGCRKETWLFYLQRPAESISTHSAQAVDRDLAPDEVMNQSFAVLCR